MAHVYELATSLHNFAGDFFQNVFAYELTEAGVATPYEYAAALLDAFDSTINATYMDLFGSDVLWDFSTAKRITGGGGPSATKINSRNGLGALQSISAGIAYDIAWQTAAASNRPGHTYITGMQQGQLDGGQWITAYNTKILSWITAMLPPLTLTGALGSASFGVYSRKLAQFNVAQHGVRKPKPTMMNRRTLPTL